MAKPNYSFEKRQREIAKQKKKAEKLARKQAAKADPDDSGAGASEPSVPPPAGDPSA